MNEQTRQALDAYIQKIITLADQATDFSVEQVPLLVQEWLRWYAVSSALWIVVGIVVIVMGIRFGRRLRASDDGETRSFGTGLPVVCALVAAAVIAANTFDLAKVLIAPRLVIVQEAVRLVRPGP